MATAFGWQYHEARALSAPINRLSGEQLYTRINISL
jgi:hypothetical protein